MKIRENKKYFQPNQNQPSKFDEELFFLQKYLTKKISEATDENLIRFYLQETGKVAQQRLTLMNSGGR